MSWSINIIGKPKNVSNALEIYSEKLSGQSKVEFDAALPYMMGLVQQNFNENEQLLPVIKIEASGYGYVQDGVQKYRNCICKIETHHAELV